MNFRLLLLSAVSFTVFGCDKLGGMCANDIAHAAPSPDNTRTAYLFQRDCGATTGFSTQVSILNAGMALANKSGNVFIADGHPEDNAASIEWQDAKTLLITVNPEAEQFLVRTQYEDVRVLYRSPITK